MIDILVCAYLYGRETKWYSRAQYVCKGIVEEVNHELGLKSGGEQAGEEY